MIAQGPADNAFKDFLDEAEESVDRLGLQLADLVEAAETGELDPELLNSIFRAAHSLKGLAGMFGLTNIANVSHALEHLLDRLRLGKVELTRPVLLLLQEAQSLIETLLRDVSVNNVSAHAEESAACIARITAGLTSQEESGPSKAADRTADLPGHLLDSLTEYERHRLAENLKLGKQIFIIHASFELASFDLELARLTDSIKERGEVISTLPGIGDRIETHIDFDLLYGTGLTFEEVAAWVGSDSILVSHAARLPADDSPLPAQEPDQAGRPSRSTVRVDIAKLDELLNTVGDLVLTHASISAIALSLRNQGITRLGSDLLNASRQLERRLADLRRGVMEIRMIPIGRLHEKMSRIVRRISREQGKQVELNFIGGATELDKMIVEEISDPMMHIIHNAVDHGIETPEQRAARGKPPAGTITISALQKGNYAVIEIDDDGNGIDLDRVRSNALKQGLVNDPDALSDRETLDLIFRPGFSTSAEVSEVSGRGVGLDVVRNNIAAISGQVAIETRAGAGTRFTLTIPTTLAIIKALIVSCGGRTYATPSSSVYEALLLNNRDLHSGVIRVREATLPLLRLDSYFAIDRRENCPDELYAVIAGVGERRIGLVVDELLGQQDIVIKPLGPAFKGLEGICGAAELGDQRTILVLDLAAMVAFATNDGGR